MITFKTKSLHEAAVLMAQEQFEVEYMLLEPIPEQFKKFKFVLQIDASEEDFSEFRRKYMNQKIMIEPKTYDAKLNVLRDNLSVVKGILLMALIPFATFLTMMA